MIPLPSDEDRAAAAGWHDGRAWMKQYEDCVAIARDRQPRLVLLGDSITQSFGGPGRRTGQSGRAVLDTLFPEIVIGNMGISGDRTQHLLWRIRNGTLDTRVDTTYMVAIGTNNIGHDPPADIARGIETIVSTIRTRRPDCPILLSPVLPRGHQPDDPGRLSAEAINRLIRPLAEDPMIHWVECSALITDGRLAPGCHAGDGLHLAVPGYEAWGAAIKDAYRASRSRQTRPSG
jgi:lysophospholipase L1-like esterase